MTGNDENPSAVLIRGMEGFPGPGRVGQKLQLDRSSYSETSLTPKESGWKILNRFQKSELQNVLGLNTLVSGQKSFGGFIFDVLKLLQQKIRIQNQKKSVAV